MREKRYASMAMGLFLLGLLCFPIAWAVMNGKTLDDTVQAGTLLKIVK